MSETLREKQSRFVRMVGQLINKATELGYELTLGEAYRDPDWARQLAKAGMGIARSLHCDRLAIDVNLFKDGRWQYHTEDFQELGEWWESIGGTWGGRFEDGNHFSLAHGGRK